MSDVNDVPRLIREWREAQRAGLATPPMLLRVRDGIIVVCGGCEQQLFLRGMVNPILFALSSGWRMMPASDTLTNEAMQAANPDMQRLGCPQCVLKAREDEAAREAAETAAAAPGARLAQRTAQARQPVRRRPPPRPRLKLRV